MSTFGEILRYAILASFVFVPLTLWLNGKSLMAVFDPPKGTISRYGLIAVLTFVMIEAVLGKVTGFRTLDEVPFRLGGTLLYGYVWARTILLLCERQKANG